MKRFAVLLALLAAPLACGQELTVQREWRLAVVGLALPDDLDAVRLLRRVERGVCRELPGLDVRIAVDLFRNHPAPAEQGLSDGELVRYAIALSEEDGLEPASYDVVFVISPLYTEPYFGRSHIDAIDKQGRAVRGAMIQADPGRLLLAGLEDTFAGRAPAPGFSPERQTLPPAVRRLLLRLIQGRPAWLIWLTRRPWIREAFLAPVMAHEFGHFLAPGDLDIRDGYQTKWLAHATGPDDNPAGHALECCMYKGRSASFYWRKVLAHLRRGGRLILYCDPCRERLGCE